MKKLDQKINKLPLKPGVYLFKNDAEEILYIGKAKNLKKRVKSHFIKTSVVFLDFVQKIKELDFIQTSTEKEAILLEAQMIKKYQPKFNILLKDDKNFFFVVIANQDWPRLSITHQIKKLSLEKNELIGPFISGRELKKLLADLRKILPYCSCRHKKKTTCLYADLNLCPAPFLNQSQQKIKNYQLCLKALKAILRLQQAKADKKLRLEFYDISNTSGQLAVGSMVVWQKNKIDKSQYRKFKIKTIAGQNDVWSLAEVLNRRLKHTDWPQPDLIILDGGKAQLQAGRKIELPVIALSKKGRSAGRLHSPWTKYSINLTSLPQYLQSILLQLRDEAHRFALSYHQQRREKIN